MYKSFNKKSSSHSKIKQLGQGMTEYIIIVAVIAVAAIGAFGFFGDAIEHQVAGLATEVSGGSGGGEIGLAQGSAAASTAAAAQHKSLANYDQNSQATNNGGD